MMKTFDINGKITVSFDPDDKEFAARVFDTLSTLNRLHGTFKRKCGQIEPREVYDLSVQTDSAMRQVIDTLFDMPVCGALFTDSTAYAAAGGSPLWFNLMEGIVNELTVPLSGECRRILRKYKVR